MGKYISIEKHIEKTKDAYYAALEDTSINWHEGNQNPLSFIKYMLGVVLACYREFEERISYIGENTVIASTRNGKERSKTVRSTAYDIVRAAVDSKLGKFTKMEIANICPSISIKSVETSMKKLVEKGCLKKHGSGRDTFYVRSF